MTTTKQKPKQDMKVGIETITPDIAREWLATNIGNRNVRRTVVDRYATDMRDGHWQLNGEAIVLNGERVLDGQHRLLACVQAETAFDSIVVRDAPTEAMQTIDQGMSRTVADVLRWRGYHDPMNLSAAARTSWRWDRGVLFWPITPSVNQVADYLDENPSLVGAVAFAGRLRKPPLKLRSSVAGPVFQKAVAHCGDTAHEFFDRLIDGEHIAGGDPLYALRRILITNATRRHDKLTAISLMALTIKGWNAWVLGSSVESLRWRRSGSAVERFPVMLDLDGNPISAEQDYRSQ